MSAPDKATPWPRAPLPQSPSAEHVMGTPKLRDPITTVEELLALPDDGLRHELLDGEP